MPPRASRSRSPAPSRAVATPGRAASPSPKKHSTGKAKASSLWKDQLPLIVIVVLLSLLLAVPALEPLRAMLTLDAKPPAADYPPLLQWGNAMWGVLTYRKQRGSTGFLFSILVTYVLYTMPANIFTCLLFLGRVPSAFTNVMTLAAHLACCVVIELLPKLGDALSSPVPYLLIDSLGVFDNATTQMNFMTDAYNLNGKKSIALAVLAGMCTNLAGGICRHFAASGFTNGAATFDKKLGAGIRYSLAVNLLYATFALYACDADMDRDIPHLGFKVIHLYEGLAWIAMTRNAVM